MVRLMLGRDWLHAEARRMRRCRARRFAGTRPRLVALCVGAPPRIVLAGYATDPRELCRRDAAPQVLRTIDGRRRAIDDWWWRRGDQTVDCDFAREHRMHDSGFARIAFAVWSLVLPAPVRLGARIGVVQLTSGATRAEAHSHPEYARMLAACSGG